MVKIENNLILLCNNFWYLEATTEKNRGSEFDMANRVRSEWAKWRQAIGSSCDHQVPLGLKRQFYKTTVRPAIYDAQICDAYDSYK